MNEVEFEQQKRAILAISDPLGLLKYGAAELKRMYNRNLGIALAVSVGVHVLLIGLLFLTDNHREKDLPTSTTVTLLPLPAPKTTPPEVIRIADEGSSGALDSDVPKGPAMRGDRRYAPEAFRQNTAKPTPSNEKPPKDMKPVGNKPVPTRNAPDLPRPSSPLDRDSVKGVQTNNPDGSVGGGAGGTGSIGIGGGGTGAQSDGLGSRGWAARPRVKYPDESNATGTVRLDFTVLPNGEITNIVPAKRASRELVDAAMAGLRRARANPLPDNAPQVPQRSWLTISFVLK